MSRQILRVKKKRKEEEADPRVEAEERENFSDSRSHSGNQGISRVLWSREGEEDEEADDFQSEFDSRSG